jgi:hypothetical protein
MAAQRLATLKTHDSDISNIVAARSIKRTQKSFVAAANENNQENDPQGIVVEKCDENLSDETLKTPHRNRKGNSATIMRRSKGS